MLNEFYIQYKVYIWVFAALLLIGLIGWGLYRLLVFQVVSTTPNNNSKISAGATTVTFSFNKELGDISSIKIKASDNIILKSEVSKTNLNVYLVNLQQDKSYTIYLQNITSTDGQKIDDYQLHFSNLYIPYNQQSREAQDQAIKTTDKGNIDDQAVKILPKYDKDYSITYELFSEPSQKGKYVKLHITLLLSQFDVNNKTKIAEYKNKALEFLKSNGLNPNDYVIEYDPPQAANL